MFPLGRCLSPFSLSILDKKARQYLSLCDIHWNERMWSWKNSHFLHHFLLPTAPSRKGPYRNVSYPSNSRRDEMLQRVMIKFLCRRSPILSSISATKLSALWYSLYQPSHVSHFSRDVFTTSVQNVLVVRPAPSICHNTCLLVHDTERFWNICQ